MKSFDVSSAEDDGYTINSTPNMRRQDSQNSYSMLSTKRTLFQEKIRRNNQGTKMESHQYEQEESDIWWHHQLQR